jgi:hypothetical protein
MLRVILCRAAPVDHSTGINGAGPVQWRPYAAQRRPAR